MGRISVLIAMRGTAEESFLRALHGSSRFQITRRCADGAEVLAAALAGVGDLAVVDAQLGVDRSFVHRLRRAGVLAVVIAPLQQHAALADMGAHPLVPETEDIPAALVEMVDGGGQPEIVVEEVEPPSASNVIAIMSAWGSPGRTSVAVNLAAELALRGGDPLLVDADLWGASIKQYLGLDPDGAGLAAAIRAVERGTFEVDGLQRLAEEAHGVRVLGGLNRSDRWREISGEALSSFWEVVQGWPGYVVIDSPVRIPIGDDDALGAFGPAPNGMWDAILQAANDICVVGSADTVGVHRFVNFYLDGQVPAPHTVINRVRASAGGPRARESVEELLARFAGIADPVLIPDDAAVDRAILEAAPLAAAAPKAPAREGLETLADRFSPQRKRARKRRRVGSLRRDGAH